MTHSLCMLCDGRASQVGIFTNKLDNSEYQIFLFSLFNSYQLFFLCSMIYIERQMKKIIIELTNRLPKFIRKSIDGLDVSIFFFLVLFLIEKTAFDLLVFCSLQPD